MHADAGVEPVGAGNEFGDTGTNGSGSGSGSGSAAPAPAASACGCCVDSVTISNIGRIDNATHMGHSFDLTVAMNYPVEPGTTKRPCSLDWGETTNVPYAAGMAANTRTNMFALIPSSPTLAPWVNRTNPCGSTERVVINDTPSLGKRAGRTVTRTLAFDIVITSQGLCQNATRSAAATQTLAMVNGAPDWTASSFV